MDTLDYTLPSTSALDLDCAASLLPTDVHPDSDRPDTARPALVEMREACKLPDDLFGGTRKMRKNAATWLPPEEKDSPTNYRVRVSRSTCFPFYRDTLGDLAARPFGRELTWEQEPPESFAEFLRDVDGTGKSLTVLARDVLLMAMHRGMEHVLRDAADGGHGGVVGGPGDPGGAGSAMGAVAAVSGETVRGYTRAAKSAAAWN